MAPAGEVHSDPAESALLAAFVENPCRVLSRDQLRRAVVGHGAQAYDRNVDMLIAIQSFMTRLMADQTQF